MINKIEGFDLLTKKQQEYFKLMNSQSGVLFVKSEPGVAKSSIMRSIATKLNMAYIDLRLSMVDEVDVGLFPFRKEVNMEIESKDGNKNIEKLNVMSFAIPEWAYEANLRPTIIHFEELNRASLAVRNAAMQILLDRAIGPKFKFNKHVYMVASGNLGESDGTDVEEFDRALNNRLIHVKHDLTLPEWIADFANDNIHPVIVNFLTIHEDKFINSFDEKNSKEQDAYATPRSWTFLSDYIVKNYGMESSIRDWKEDIMSYSSSFVGTNSAQRFIRYLDDVLRFGVDDVLNRFDEIKAELEKSNRDKKSELLNTLKNMDLTKLKSTQLENLKKFILSISEDEAVSFILKLVDSDMKHNSDDDHSKFIESFLSDKRFHKFYKTISAHLDNSTK